MHPRLEEVRADEFDVDDFLAREPPGPRVALVEFPHKDYQADDRSPLEERLSNRLRPDRRLGRSPLSGGWWYDHEFVDWLLGYTHLLTASAPSLVRSLREKSGRDVIEVPNGVNARIFDLAPEHHRSPRPSRRRRSCVRISRIALRRLVRLDRSGSGRHRLPGREDHPDRRPAAHGSPSYQPTSICWASNRRRPFRRYLAQADVGLIPFVVSKTTHAVSPLKAFEYLAMGRAGGSSSSGTSGRTGVGVYPHRSGRGRAAGTGLTASRPPGGTRPAWLGRKAVSNVSGPGYRIAATWPSGSGRGAPGPPLHQRRASSSITKRGGRRSFRSCDG